MVKEYFGPGTFSTPLERFGPAVVIWGSLQGLQGATFMTKALSGGVPMPPAVHGSAIYIMSAEAWALAIMVSSSLIILGPVTGRAILTFLGSVIGSLVYVVFFVLADTAEFGFLLATGAATTHNGSTAACGFVALLTMLQKARAGERRTD